MGEGNEGTSSILCLQQDLYRYRLFSPFPRKADLALVHVHVSVHVSVHVHVSVCMRSVVLRDKPRSHALNKCSTTEPC